MNLPQERKLLSAPKIAGLLPSTAPIPQVGRAAGCLKLEVSVPAFPPKVQSILGQALQMLAIDASTYLLGRCGKEHLTSSCSQFQVVLMTYRPPEPAVRAQHRSDLPRRPVTIYPTIDELDAELMPSVRRLLLCLDNLRVGQQRVESQP